VKQDKRRKMRKRTMMKKKVLTLIQMKSTKVEKKQNLNDIFVMYKANNTELKLPHLMHNNILNNSK
jgi:hypothetical protein